MLHHPTPECSPVNCIIFTPLGNCPGGVNGNRIAWKKHKLIVHLSPVSVYYTQNSVSSILCFYYMFPQMPKYNFYLITISFVILELKIYHILLILSKSTESEVVSTIIWFMLTLLESISYTGKLLRQAIFLGKWTVLSCLYYWGRDFLLFSKVHYMFWLVTK